MPRPTADDLPPVLRAAARAIAEPLRGAGFEAWVVGGAVRDLALGRVPGDVDLATDARPEEIEGLFEHTTAVGRAFGTIVVRPPVGPELGGDAIAVEVTTFRSDGEYRDGRRPEEVTYGSSVQEDARRRDFTCNALYLDPLDDRFLDPERGLEDLAAGCLRCVGDARRRFVEDGLRLLRLARFEARFGLEPEPATLAGAREAGASLTGVSAERVLAELRGIFASPRPARAFARLAELELVERALPGWRELARSAEAERERLALLVRALEHTGGELPMELGLALLLDPDPRDELDAEASVASRAAAEACLKGLHPSRREREAVRAVWSDREGLRALLSREVTRRSERLLLMRRDAWPWLRRAVEAWDAASRGALLASSRGSFEALVAERDGLSREELFPAPLLESRDLEAGGIPRGARWGELLAEVERKQLDEELGDREAALAWLAGQAPGPTQTE